ncbi:MAG TPA: Glu/Leu/Phe/Val dehydrogenase dimerization domain-containing protein [Rubrivivax sp.]|nr:Glu/Leu/Phe/Val dehydrogenase dimerization domain-containing protein [Rubrivivax sp.]
MAVFNLSGFADHEQVVFASDYRSGLKAVIAIHDSNLGPALGGCRMWPYAREGMWPYASEEEAIRDVLRLSRGMTCKSAMAELGGGKPVIIGNPRTQKTPELLAALARALERLNGRCIAAEDSGTSVHDMKYVAQFTRHVAGPADKPSDRGTRSGDPSAATAYGTFIGVKAAVQQRLGRDSLDGLDVVVFAPCALGAVLNDSTIAQLKAKVVAGASNNQLAEPRRGVELMQRGILYAPDYIINAGGIIDVHHERIGFDRAAPLEHIERIRDNLMEVFARRRGRAPDRRSGRHDRRGALQTLS